MKLKSLLTVLFIYTSGLLFASNEIYLDQIGSAGIFNISQIGSSNKLGEGTNRSRIEGEEVIFNVGTIGNENLIDIDSIGNEELVNLNLEGDANELILALHGDKNEVNTFISVFILFLDNISYIFLIHFISSLFRFIVKAGSSICTTV